jgi:uncharacterized protein
MGKNVNVEVAYATPEKQVVIPVNIQDDAQLIEAILVSGVLEMFPELRKVHDENVFSLKVGIFSKPRDLGEYVSEGDRIEIYRLLENDPKEMRRSRASAMK